MCKRRAVSVTLAWLLAMSPVLSLNVAAAPAQGSPVQIGHDAVNCAVAGQFPLLSATFEPADSVAKARIYFRSTQGSEFYYVEMTPGPGGYFGKLPAPRGDIGSFVYYIEVMSKDMSVAQTAENTVTVPANRAGCPPDSKVAPVGPGGGVSVFSTTGATVAPSGFGGISSVAAGGSIAAGGAVAGGAATGAGGAAAGGIVAGSAGAGLGTGALIAGGALLVGAGTAIVISQNSASQ